MKGKVKTYALLIAVLVVWGILGFKVLDTIKPKQSEIEQNRITTWSAPKVNFVDDKFLIQYIERDPFLGTLYNKGKVNAPTKEKHPRNTLVWIPILYHGAISKQGSKEKVYVISINGMQQIIKLGQVINEVKLIRATNKEIMVEFKGKIKTFEKT